MDRQNVYLKVYIIGRCNCTLLADENNNEDVRMKIVFEIEQNLVYRISAVF